MIVVVLAVISIHRSLAGPDCALLYDRKDILISIHRSLAGPDPARFVGAVVISISIHRSLAGPDTLSDFTSNAPVLFQSTGPLRDPTHKM